MAKYLNSLPNFFFNFTHSGWKWKHSLSCECVLLMIHMLVSQAFVVKMMLSCNYKYNVTDTKNKSSKISDAPFHMFCGPRLVLKAKRAKLLPFIFVYVLNALFIYLSAYLSYQQTAVYNPSKHQEQLVRTQSYRYESRKFGFYNINTNESTDIWSVKIVIR